MNKEEFFNEMDNTFEEIMRSGNLPKGFDERLSKEDRISEKLNDLKIATKRASDMELDFLLTNLEYLLNTMLQNDSVRRDFEYHKELKRVW